MDSNTHTSTARDALQALVDAMAMQATAAALLTRVTDLTRKLETACYEADRRRAHALDDLADLARDEPHQISQVSVEMLRAAESAEGQVSALERDVAALVQRAAAEGYAL